MLLLVILTEPKLPHNTLLFTTEDPADIRDYLERTPMSPEDMNNLVIGSGAVISSLMGSDRYSEMMYDYSARMKILPTNQNS